ncbi:MAG: hypothetical protein R3B82_20895 [Sandaracinaceae bacterium]
MPAVIGAYISLGRCFDLTDSAATKQLGGFYDDLCLAMEVAGGSVPENRKAPGREAEDLVLRNRDCAVLNLGLTNLDAAERG